MKLAWPKVRYFLTRSVQPPPAASHSVFPFSSRETRMLRPAFPLAILARNMPLLAFVSIKATAARSGL